MSGRHKPLPLPPIRSLGYFCDPAPLRAELAAHPELWNEHTARTVGAASPHREADDIYLRWNPNAGDWPHTTAWYLAADKLPAAKVIAAAVLAEHAGELGGVLLTRIPPGRRVYPHRDTGWHAATHSKYAIQIASAPGQAFCFQDAGLSPEAGELYTFDNSQLHWVYNMSDEPRMTLIICIRETAPCLGA